MRPDQDDHYAVLEVGPGSSQDEIRSSWRFLLAAFHPDRFRDADQRERAQEITKRLNAAWQVLGDEGLRARYDAVRVARAPAPAMPAGREVPCPACAARGRTPDAGGALVALVCPACGIGFQAIVGARWVERPRLSRRWLGMTYEAQLADAAGARTTVSFRRLPSELALPEGELVSVVLRPGRDRPAYVIVHGSGIDICWPVA